MVEETLPEALERLKPVLSTRSLSVGYGDTAVVHDVNVDVAAGELVCVVGPNGAGKSTLEKGILGIAKVFSGSVLLDGGSVAGLQLEDLVRRGLGYVPQVDDTFLGLRVRENLEMGGYLVNRRIRAERIEEVLQVFPALRDKLSRFVGTMSGGERKMVAVARAMMTDPRVFVLDEPTAGLSPHLTRVVLEDQARRLADLGKAVLLVEQKARVALELADWSYVMVQGRIVRDAPAATVLEDPEMAEVFLSGSIQDADR